ncbi:zinc finger protein 28-like [Wyeomyia smithii]|uniref:zinc finger protein 28-like n=1 Tax=Wyeomyia smithii TaxID=174621 RepID=UPI002467C28B|nr:zinc finger protein 28-like [Wyeomyia smithii]XP_055533902.1 zinc finger protein 28-like [Wyeomyia smithii]
MNASQHRTGMDRISLSLNGICRFCLGNSEQLYLLFGLHKDAATVIENVRLVTTIELSTTDNIDYKICAKCCTEYEQCLNFRHKCREANEQLVKALRSRICHKSPFTDEIEIVSQLNVPGIDQLFDPDTDPTATNSVHFELDGMDPVSPPLLECSSWSEPFWGGDPYETQDKFLPSSSSAATGQNSNPINAFELSCNKIGRSKYYCKICEKHFFQRNVHLQHHRRYSKMCFQCLDEKLIGIYRKELATVRHTCRICLSPKESCAEFLQHTIGHHAEEHRARDSYKCDQCDKVFMLRSETGRGRIHSCVRKLRCPHCPQVFYYAKSYQKHLRLYHNVINTEPKEASETRVTTRLQSEVDSSLSAIQ